MKRISITGFIITLLLTAFSAFAQTQSRDDLLKQIESKRAELGALEKLFLAPSEEDQATYAEFLRQPDTGLIRLLPREKYDSEVYKKNNRSLTIRGAGAYYSFALKTHEYGFGTDIGLEQSQLSTFAMYGMLTFLDNVPLESVTLDTVDAQALTKTGTEKIRNRTHAPLKPNSTYLVRSIDYDKTDVLVAFRVVRVDTDGSAIILWKLLKSFPVTQVAGKN